jgi:hypothetical protein
MNANPVDFLIMFPFTGIDRRDVQYGGKAGGTVNNGFINPLPAWSMAIKMVSKVPY